MNIRKESIDFISNLHSVNSLLLRILTSNVAFSELCKAVDFYNANKDCVAFETLALNLTFEDNNELKSTIFSSILSEVFRYRDVYKRNEDMLSKFYPSDIWSNDIVARIHETEDLIKKTSVIGSQISTMIRSSFDDCEESIIIHKIKDKKLRELQTEHCLLIKKLNERYDSYFEDLELQEVYEVKVFYLIYYLMLSLELVASKYAPKEVFEQHLGRVERIGFEQGTGAGEPVHFDMTLISAIYNICNKEQFEEISEIEFYKSINNPTNCSPNFKIKKTETMRVCYLIHLLSERLNEPLRSQWRGQILEKLEISASYYKSKYRNAVSSDASIRSVTFANDMRNIFK